MLENVQLVDPIIKRLLLYSILFPRFVEIGARIKAHNERRLKQSSKLETISTSEQTLKDEFSLNLGQCIFHIAVKIF